MFARYIYAHPRYLILLFLCVIAVGVNSFRSIPRQENPTLTNFVGAITTFFPGASPDRVEALVSRVLEDELRKIPEIDKVHSTSSTGVSSVNVFLFDSLPEETLERAWSEVRDAMADASRSFPSGVGRSSFENDRLTAFTAIIAFTSNTDVEIPLSLLHRLALDFADRARNMTGTRLVELFGEPSEEIRVEVDHTELAARGLSLQQVSAALRAADVKIAAGSASGAGADLLIELAGALDSMERIRQVTINTAANGSSTRVADIATVYKAAVSPPQTMALAQGRQAILVGAIMEDKRQVDTWSEAFHELVETYRAEAPAGLKLEVSFEQVGYARARLIDVSINLAIGVALVMLVLLFTMGWRAAVVVAVVLPVCGLMSITAIERMGISLDQLSVSGLIVAIGLLVDGSIVMTDEVRKRLHQGHGTLAAITGSVDRLQVPLLASALTTILTFMPFAIMTGAGGDFLGNLSWAVISMLVSSTVMALAITPVLAVWLLPKGATDTLSWYNRGLDSGRGGKWLAQAIDWSVHNPLGAVALALALPLCGLLAFPTLTTQFFPGTDRDQLYVQVKLADGRSIKDTRQLVDRLDARLRKEALIRRVDWSLGESAPAFFYNMYRFRQGIPSFAEALVLTRDENQTDALIRRLQLDFDRDFPAARIIVRGMDQSPPIIAPLEVELHGPNLETLREYGELLRRRMDNLPSVLHTTMNLIGGAPKLIFSLDEDKLRMAQLHLTDVANVMNDSLLGITGGEVLEGTERLPVRVRLREQDWSRVEAIANLHIPGKSSPVNSNPLNSSAISQSGLISGIPLNALGEATLEPALSPITRINGERVNTVQAFITRGVLPLEVLAALKQDLADNPLPLPQGYSIVYGGEEEARAEVVEKIVAPLGLILAALLATIVLTFNAWRLAGISVLVCVCSVGLSILSLAILQYPFGILALTGVIGSIGVSINAAIIIMTGLQQHAQASVGNLLAVREVVMDSSRHIVSTTATTFGGFLPLILEGSEFWPPFAVAIAGGVLLSTIVSFFLVPPLYVLVYRGRHRRPKFSKAATQVPRGAMQ